jgi:hypothetical protein
MMKSISGIGSIFLLTSSLAIATIAHPAAARSNSDQLSALQSSVVQPWLLAGRSGPLRSAQAVPKKKILGIFGQPTPTPSASSSPGVTKTGASPTPSPTTTPAASPTPTPTTNSSSPGVTKAGTASPAAVVAPVNKSVVKKRNIRGMFGQPALKKPVTKAGTASPTSAPTEKKVLGTFSPATPQPTPSSKTSGQKLLGIFNR